MSKRDDPQLRVRIPAELKETLEKKAKVNKRTLTAEIVDRLEATVAQDFVNSNYFKNGNQKDSAYSNMAVDFEALTYELEDLRKMNGQLTDLEWVNENEEELYEAVSKLQQILSRKK
ncbi:Arc family DNA-binding protein [Yersinia pseudotuberculosis]|uniref:Arc family DNA-binding protein n=1 Tax=Yersinia pseudotuberculosis TaxID=633 RepID=UPI001A9EDE69|nr:Arc family DNA-binding protein [Yersinia pseudotuberculosis]MBO1563540.1 Arc family DNA-binding protein [Yersinia pseudotuberculosis]